jgi:hypothetical protein
MKSRPVLAIGPWSSPPRRERAFHFCEIISDVQSELRQTSG